MAALGNWLVDSLALTTSYADHKLRRQNLMYLPIRRYGQTFEEMYQQMEARQKERQNQLRDQAAQGSVLDKVHQVSADEHPLPSSTDLFSSSGP